MPMSRLFRIKVSHPFFHQHNKKKQEKQKHPREGLWAWSPEAKEDSNFLVLVFEA